MTTRRGRYRRRGRWKMSPSVSAVFDGEIGILPLPATFADPHGLPSGDRIRGQPHGDIASLDQCSVVCRPISDVVFCLVLRVHSRLHVEIIHLPSLRWPGGRSWRTEGAGSVHQRRSAAAPPHTAPTTTLSAPSGAGCGRPVRPRAGSRSPVSPRGSPARLPRVGGREMVSGGGLRRVDDVGGPHLVRVVGPRVVRAGNGGSHRGKALGRPRTQLSRRFGHQVGATCVYVSDLVHAGRFRAEGA